MKVYFSLKSVLLLIFICFNQFVTGNENLDPKLKHIENQIIESLQNGNLKTDSLCSLLFKQNQYGICLGYYYKGEIAYYQAEWSVATDYYQKAIDCFLNYNDTARLATAYNNLGLVLLFQSFYNRSLDALSKSLEYEVKRKNIIGIAQSYQNASMVYENQYKYEMAIEYNLKAIKILENSDNEVDLAGAFNNMAILYSNEGNYKDAENYYIKAKDIYNKLNMNEQEAKVLCNIGSLLIKKGKNSEGRELLERALELFHISNDVMSEISAYGMLADFYGKQNEYLQAIFLSETAYKMAKETDALGLQLSSLYSLYIYYKKMEKWKESMTYYEKYLTIKDTLQTSDSIYKDYVVNVELGHKNNEIESLNKQIAQIKANFKITVIIFSIIIIAGIFVLCFFIKWLKNRKKWLMIKD